MEDLVDRTDLVDGALVKAVMAALPGESIERVLDETRKILIQRGLSYVKSEFSEDMEIIIEDLAKIGYSIDDIKTILVLFFKDQATPERAHQLAEEALRPINSTPRRCLCFRWRR
jgi:hypothetical protein